MRHDVNRFVWAHRAVVCVYDPERGIGAQVPLREGDGAATLDALVAWIVQQGGDREGLVGRVYGEGPLVADAVRQLGLLQIPLRARDAGLRAPLLVRFDPTTGEARAQSLDPQPADRG